MRVVEKVENSGIQYDKQMQLAKRSASTCHFERSESEVEKSKNVQFILCHFERSEAKSKNLRTLVYAATRYFGYAQYDTVVALNITPWLYFSIC